MHLAMESGHGEATVVLIEAGADRERVSNGGAPLLLSSVLNHGCAVDVISDGVIVFRYVT